ncbi:uncharacterized protein [Miscanthus floridulus]|uniref:uncharacterized protein n=1 Tax=Miscanthus floridulus TaxID=154761 RepID=UPI003459D7FD
MGVREARRQPGGLDGRGGVGGGRGDATAPTEDRGGAGVRRGPAGTGRYRGHATAVAIAIAEEGRSAKAVVSPFEAEVPALAPRKALKVSTSSTAQWVVEAQAAVQRGVAMARTNLKEPVAQGGATKAATRQAEEEEPTPRGAEAHESDGAKAPSVAEATEGKAEAPQTSKAEAMEAEAPRTLEAEVVGTEAPETTEVGVARAGMSTVKPAA